LHVGGERGGKKWVVSPLRLTVAALGADQAPAGWTFALTFASFRHLRRLAGDRPRGGRPLANCSVPPASAMRAALRGRFDRRISRSAMVCLPQGTGGGSQFAIVVGDRADSRAFCRKFMPVAAQFPLSLCA
jgi:hypothetical protein